MEYFRSNFIFIDKHFLIIYLRNFYFFEQNLTFFGRFSDFFCGFSQQWKIDFSWWFWSLGKKFGQKNETFFKNFYKNLSKSWSFLKSLITIILKEIIKFDRKSWCLCFIRAKEWSNFLQMGDTDFREDPKFVIWEHSVNFYTCKSSRSKSS